MKEDDNVELMEKEKSIILSNLSNEVLIELVKEKDEAKLWAKLEKLYQMKVLNNHLYNLKMMFQFRVATNLQWN